MQSEDKATVRRCIWDAHRSCWRQPEPGVWLILQDPWSRRGLRITGRERKIRNRRGSWKNKVQHSGSCRDLQPQRNGVCFLVILCNLSSWTIMAAEFYIREAKPEDVVSTGVSGRSNVSNQTVANHPGSRH